MSPASSLGFQLRLRSGDTRYVWLTGKTKKRPNGPTGSPA
jgi:hypothetical protein